MFPKKGKVFPKTGKVLPAAGGGPDPRAIYATAIARALRDEFGQTPNATKTVMRWTGASERSVKNWLAGSNGPAGEHLVALLRHSEAVFDALVRVAGRRKVTSTIAMGCVFLSDSVKWL